MQPADSVVGAEDNRQGFLLDYIIAASFRKMNARMNSKFSKKYHDCLKNLNLSDSELPSKEPDTEAHSNKPAPRNVPFIKDIHRLAGVLPIPNLLESAKNGEPNEIYNNSTRKDFHTLLLILFDRFKKALADLNAFKSGLGSESPVPVEVALDALMVVQVSGSFLRRIVRSSALETHLRTNEHSLHSILWTPELDPDSESSDFEYLQPQSLRKGIRLELWQSYRDWLRLMVHYFDAADILTTHVRGLTKQQPHAKISITILTPPQSDKRMLSFTELLESERFFPTLPDEPTGRELAEFFRTTPDAVDCGDKRGPTFYEQLMKGSRVAFSGSNHCEAYIASLLAFEGRSVGRGAEFEELNISKLDVEKVTKLLLKIKASHFFTHHLNLLLILTTQGSQQAIGVSKRCCPLCASLLSLLNHHYGTKFVITDVHPTFTGCDLSSFLPGEVVFKMVEASSKMLRAEIKKLKGDRKRRRADTSDTARMSTDSLCSLMSMESNAANVRKVYGDMGPGSAV